MATWSCASREFELRSASAAIVASRRHRPDGKGRLVTSRRGRATQRNGHVRRSGTSGWRRRCRPPGIADAGTGCHRLAPGLRPRAGARPGRVRRSADRRIRSCRRAAGTCRLRLAGGRAVAPRRRRPSPCGSGRNCAAVHRGTGPRRPTLHRPRTPGPVGAAFAWNGPRAGLAAPGDRGVHLLASAVSPAGRPGQETVARSRSRDCRARARRSGAVAGPRSGGRLPGVKGQARSTGAPAVTSHGFSLVESPLQFSRVGAGVADRDGATPMALPERAPGRHRATGPCSGAVGGRCGKPLPVRRGCRFMVRTTAGQRAGLACGDRLAAPGCGAYGRVRERRPVPAASGRLQPSWTVGRWSAGIGGGAGGVLPASAIVAQLARMSRSRAITSSQIAGSLRTLISVMRCRM